LELEDACEKKWSNSQQEDQKKASTTIICERSSWTPLDKKEDGSM